MRSLLAASFSLLATHALALPHARADQDGRQHHPQVLEHDIEKSYTRFTVPCLAPGACSGADDYLEFEVHIDAEDSPSELLALTLNGERLQLQFIEYPAVSVGSLTAKGVFDANHTVNYSIWSSAGSTPDNAVQQVVRFKPYLIDSDSNTNFGFSLVLDRSRSPHLQGLTVDTGPVLKFQRVIDRGVVKSGFATGHVMLQSQHEDDFDLPDELDTLYLLEAQAEHLKEQIVIKKRLIAQHLKDGREHVPLSALLEECDGLVCAAHVVAQRICDKMGVLAEPSLSYARKQNPRLQHAFGSLNVQQNSRNCTKSKAHVTIQAMNEKTPNGTAHGMNIPFTVTKNSTSPDYHLIDGSLAPNPLLRALTVLASVLGLIALFRFIHRRCMSMRKRVERAADREERRNARAYRKAARRAAMRRRWDNLVSAVSCFRMAHEDTPQDYEEKRALILQDAFLEQLNDLDQAEKGEVMEAEIRELRHAHEIVASLVRVDEHRYDLVAPLHDPPPPLVPLPYTPEVRSRASTGTLPSYTSESLPDYSSRPETLADSGTSDSLVDGFAGYSPTTSQSEGRHTPSSTASSRQTRYTPTSSILDVSPRMSEETLRTRQSKDTRRS